MSALAFEMHSKRCVIDCIATSFPQGFFSIAVARPGTTPFITATPIIIANSQQSNVCYVRRAGGWNVCKQRRRQRCLQDNVRWAYGTRHPIWLGRMIDGWFLFVRMTTSVPLFAQYKNMCIHITRDKHNNQWSRSSQDETNPSNTHTKAHIHINYHNIYGRIWALQFFLFRPSHR